MAPDTAHLSRFELECLRLLSARGEATVREIHGALPNPPSYSTVRKIFERLEEKGAIERGRRDGRAWVFRPRGASPAMVERSVLRQLQRLLEGFFEGRSSTLLAYLAEMNALSLDDLRAAEAVLKDRGANHRRRRPGGGAPA